MKAVKIGEAAVGPDEEVYVVAEIGINHNGCVETAKKLIDVAIWTGCNAVKFQKRTPDVCVPEEQKPLMRDTPWGRMSYIEYRHRIEFGKDEYEEIDAYCRSNAIDWFASCWDTGSVEFMADFDPVAFKVASATLTDDSVLNAMLAAGKPVILSTGMSTMEEIRHAVDQLERDQLILTHATSTYPMKPAEANLRVIHTLRDEFNVPVGYSGHEPGLQISLAAVTLGACLVERHITLDRTMWGSDHAASLEPMGVYRLVRDIRVIEEALGDGVKRVYDSELPLKQKLRRNG